MKVRIDVTDMDIRQGIRRDACRCPIAHATSRALQQSYASVGPDPGEGSLMDRQWHVNLPTYEYPASITLPKEAGQFATCFDRGEDVKPFSFDLELPEK